MLNEALFIEKGTEHPEEFQPWSVRIPAAIEKAEAEISGKHHIWLSRQKDFITATEVALADELWGFANDGPCPPWPDSLIAFCEKVESL